MPTVWKRLRRGAESDVGACLSGEECAEVLRFVDSVCDSPGDAMFHAADRTFWRLDRDTMRWKALDGRIER